MVIRNIGRPAPSNMITKYSRLMSEPNTICAFDSGVDSRMLKVCASRSCVMAAAVNTGARKHISESWVVDAHLKVRDAPLASSVSEPDCPLTETMSENSTTASRATR